MAEFPTDMTVKKYRELLQKAHEALDEVDRRCLTGKPDDYTLKDEDWQCIMTEFADVTSAKGAPPIGRDSCQ